MSFEKEDPVVKISVQEEGKCWRVRATIDGDVVEDTIIHNPAWLPGLKKRLDAVAKLAASKYGPIDWDADLNRWGAQRRETLKRNRIEDWD